MMTSLGSSCTKRRTIHLLHHDSEKDAGEPLVVGSLFDDSDDEAPDPSAIAEALRLRCGRRTVSF
jgi:hypothetical protein